MSALGWLVPYRNYIALGAVLLLLGGAAGALAYRAEQNEDLGRSAYRRQVAQPRPAFTLTDTEGRPFDFREATRGHLTLLYFGYTNCPDVCPIHFANIAAGLQQVPADVRHGVRVVFVGVDPPRDSPERVREWLGHFDRSFIGLTGTDEELQAAQTAAGVPVAFRDPDPGTGRYGVNHAGWVIAYTAGDEETWEFPLGVRQESWARTLKQLAKTGGR